MDADISREEVRCAQDMQVGGRFTQGGVKIEIQRAEWGWGSQDSVR